MYLILQSCDNILFHITVCVRKNNFCLCVSSGNELSTSVTLESIIAARRERTIFHVGQIRTPKREKIKDKSAAPDGVIFAEVCHYILLTKRFYFLFGGVPKVLGVSIIIINPHTAFPQGEISPGHITAG